MSLAGTIDDIAAEARTVRELAARALSGDAYAIEAIHEELPKSIEYRDQCRAGGYDTGMLDVAIAEAERIVGGVSPSGVPMIPQGTGMILPHGLRLGNVVIPWAGVVGIAIVLYLAWKSSSSRGRSEVLA